MTPHTPLPVSDSPPSNAVSAGSLRNSEAEWKTVPIESESSALGKFPIRPENAGSEEGNLLNSAHPKGSSLNVSSARTHQGETPMSGDGSLSSATNLAGATPTSAESQSLDLPEPEPTTNPALDSILAQAVPVRSRPLVFLTILAVLYTLYFARAVLLPVALSIVLSLLLRPVVRWLSRRRIPESVGAAFCLIGLISAITIGGFQLIGPAREWITKVPEKLQEVRWKLRGVQSQLTEISEATEKLERLAAGNSPHPLEVQVQQPTLTSNVVLLSTTGAMLASVGIVIVLTYFLLTSGDALIRNIITTLPTFREKRQVVELVQNVQRGVSSYLFAVSVINAALGVVVAFAMWIIGLPNPALWGMMIALLNFIPYAGSLLCGAIIGIVAVITFDSMAYASLAPIVFFVITTIEGQVITPALLGRHMSLNPIMVFLFLTFWGWMWGIGGAVLAVPILAITRIVCDQFERTQPLGTMLSG